MEPFPDCLEAGSLFLVDVCFGFFLRLKEFFLCVEGAGEEGSYWGEGVVEGDVCENGENGIDDHDDQGADGAANGEEADHADFGKVDACYEVLEGAGIDKAFCVDVDVVDKEKVVAVGLVDEVEANEGEAED